MVRNRISGPLKRSRRASATVYLPERRRGLARMSTTTTQAAKKPRANHQLSMP